MLSSKGSLPLSNSSETLMAVDSEDEFVYLALEGGCILQGSYHCRVNVSKCVEWIGHDMIGWCCKAIRSVRLNGGKGCYSCQFLFSLVVLHWLKLMISGGTIFRWSYSIGDDEIMSLSSRKLILDLSGTSAPGPVHCQAFETPAFNKAALVCLS